MTNPYSPPKAALRDRPVVPVLAARPPQMTVALWLLWLLIALGLVLSIFEYERWEQGPVSFFVTMGLVYALAAALNVFIARRANWARWAFLATVALSFIMLPSIFQEGATYTPTELAIYIVSVVADLIILYLLFTKPGALWFRFRTD